MAFPSQGYGKGLFVDFCFWFKLKMGRFFLKIRLFKFGEVERRVFMEREEAVEQTNKLLNDVISAINSLPHKLEKVMRGGVRDIKKDLSDGIHGIYGLPHKLEKVIRGDYDHFKKACPSCKNILSILQGGKYCPYCGTEAFTDEEIKYRNVKFCRQGDRLFDFSYTCCPECGDELISLPEDLSERIIEQFEKGINEYSNFLEGIFTRDLVDYDIKEDIEAYLDRIGIKE